MIKNVMEMAIVQVAIVAVVYAKNAVMQIVIVIRRLDPFVKILNACFRPMQNHIRFASATMVVMVFA
jgi:hypothetical protein